MASKLSISKKVPKSRKSKSKKVQKKKPTPIQLDIGRGKRIPIEYNIPQREVEFTFEPRKIEEFNLSPKSKKKHGGKITYKMAGGQVVDAGYD